MGDERRFVEVAVPLPLPSALIYSLPETLIGDLRAGCRVRVRVGERRLTGVVLALRSEAPAGLSIRDVDEWLDLEPALTPELLELARFVADYYLAPIGEAVSVMLGSGLPPWGERTVALTAAGALARPRSAAEAIVLEWLLERRRARVAELARRLSLPAADRVLAALAERGWVSLGEGRGRSGTRYVKAVELRRGELAELLEACGRSAPGRAVVEMAHALGRPATVAELTAAVGCRPGVLRRLETRGVLRSFVQPQRLPLGRHRLSTDAEGRPISLNREQRRAAEALSRAAAGGGYSAFLLHGVTGSGKTEVYLRVAEEVVRRGRGVILLVPEIALVPALAESLVARFGGEVAILHSGMTAGERHQEWERLRAGTARVVVGPRSAILAPVEALGLIVVDEEHDGAYKQDSSPRYNGRDLALVRARHVGAVAVLASATPSLESRYNASRGKLAPLVLSRRVGEAALPEGVLVDLRREGATRRPGEVHFSSLLVEELRGRLDAGDQVILLRNRRGYSPLYLCRACGEDFRCSECGLPRTYHRRYGELLCHYCGGRRPAPRRCPSCEEEALEAIGAGTERVEERFAALFPEVAADVLDADATRRPGSVSAILERFGRGETQALIGTQMVAKGHHFPRVSLAAVLYADTYLGFPDFRAVERTFALVSQLAGRAGRGDRPGRVIIQTFHPDHYALRAALEHDDAAFAREEMRFRRTFHYPPYTRLLQLLARHRRRERAESTLRSLAERLLAHPDAAGVRISGPAPAPLEKLRGRWRFQLLLRGPSGRQLRRLARAILGDTPPRDVVVDVDPYDLM